MWPGITPLSLVCLRFDDYHQNISHERWVNVLTKYNDRGLRGVIAIPPKFEGEPLSSDVVPFLLELQADGWELAQHGYTHENIGEGRGGPLYLNRSEFAGVPLHEQKRRIAAGKDILEGHDIEPTTFIPPWHEYDRNTLRALSTHDFSCLNEGRLPIPRTICDITLVPTHIPAITPDLLSIGVVTLVSHPHLDAEPMAMAELVAGNENRLRTPEEIARWWQQKQFKI